jgi:uncharacterized membrane protein
MQTGPVSLQQGGSLACPARKAAKGLTMAIMQLLEALAGAFINTFGITQPTEQARRRASLFILGILLLVVCGLVVAGVVIFRLMHA